MIESEEKYKKKRNWKRKSRNIARLNKYFDITLSCDRRDYFRFCVTKTTSGLTIHRENILSTFKTTRWGASSRSRELIEFSHYHTPTLDIHFPFHTRCICCFLGEWCNFRNGAQKRIDDCVAQNIQPFEPRTSLYQLCDDDECVLGCIHISANDIIIQQRHGRERTGKIHKWHFPTCQIVRRKFSVFCVFVVVMLSRNKGFS